uniref:E3 ubiquitin-protein ligase ZNRF1 n=1 Tax=Macrostomum lignano TaxID=282301 RepID=A0A1I8HC13_9PLAT
QYLQQQQQGASGSGRHRSRSLDFLSGRPIGGAGRDSDDEFDSEDEEDDGPVIVSGGPRPPRQRGAAAAAGSAGRQHHAALLRQHLGLPSSFYRSDIRCPVCSKTVPHDEIEVHLVVCLTKPRISYNEDVLSEDKGAECAICLDDLCQGDTIARLPCLCIYHKGCIDEWFKRSRSCPEHPGDG